MSHTHRAVVLGFAIVLLGGCARDLEPAASPDESQTAVTPEPSETTAPTTPPADTPSVVNGPNTIDAPSPGGTVPGPQVHVTGEGTAFEGTLSYRVSVPGTEEVLEEGWTTAGANGEIGPYTIELTLEPGEYAVQVWEPDVSDGESPDGPYRNLVEVTFTVA